jgi:hypothetical protein
MAGKQHFLRTRMFRDLTSWKSGWRKVEEFQSNVPTQHAREQHPAVKICVRMQYRLTLFAIWETRGSKSRLPIMDTGTMMLCTGTPRIVILVCWWFKKEEPKLALVHDVASSRLM